jgi:hypothetical protein
VVAVAPPVGDALLYRTDALATVALGCSAG